ncbi:hypothetical protein AWB79_01269 [Caballeronia hypogeia]|uniref:Prophage CP4-57 regulatory protein (AlpA) n=1 Tax=Caballeronia hypogeia TaxID=1777140 RepID=A0A157ZRV9_9BURK|nr:AlpA family phage regulatory protein [Caballeronia hypogeia]SAK48252.1 hypothetical protein AWB79_01269 [Caballeronia hypogeia]
MSMKSMAIVRGGTKRPASAAEYIGVGMTKLWDLVKNDPDFPTPFKLGERTTLFYTTELDEYLASKANAQRKVA